MLVHGEICDVSLTEQCLDDLLRLSKESSPAEARPEAKFRLVLAFCLPPSRVSEPLYEFLNDLATELWSVILQIRMPICHESLLRHQCELKLLSLSSCNTCGTVCLLSYAKCSKESQGVKECRG